MNLNNVRYYIGYILSLVGVFMLPALLIALLDNDKSGAHAFAVVMVASIAVGIFCIKFKPQHQNVNSRGAFITVGLGWIVMSFVGMLPFYISGSIPSLVDCWFETVSGFTTTGSTILKNVEALSNSMLYWRSFTHWLGGMGVLVFLLAIVPQDKGNGASLLLMRAESPGPEVGKLKAKIRHTALTLYEIYVAMTLIEIILLIAGGMPIFDSVVNSFATAGTGGFAIYNASIAAYDSAYLQTVIGVFMMLFGTNFGIFYLLLTRNFKAALKNEELRLYYGIFAAVTLIITFNILSQYSSFGGALLDGFFQVSSIMTTTGFSTTNFDKWPELSRYLLVILMIIGASAGSTGGGIKVSRLLILWKSMRNAILRMVRPNTVRPVLMDGRIVPDDVTRQTGAFLFAYIVLCVISIGVLSFENLDSETNVTAVIACMGNIGPGLSLVGPVGNFSVFSDLSKLVLSADMLLGRLEIFPLLMLFSPTMLFSRKHSF